MVWVSNLVHFLRLTYFRLFNGQTHSRLLPYYFTVMYWLASTLTERIFPAAFQINQHHLGFAIKMTPVSGATVTLALSSLGGPSTALPYPAAPLPASDPTVTEREQNEGRVNANQKAGRHRAVRTLCGHKLASEQSSATTDSQSCRFRDR